MIVLLHVLAVVAFVLVALGVSPFGITPEHLLAFGLALFALAHVTAALPGSSS